VQADRGLLRRYAQFKADFERINTPEVAKLFANLDEARGRLDILEETASRLRGLRDSLAEIRSPELIDLQPSLDDWSEETQAWWAASVARKLTSRAQQTQSGPRSQQPSHLWTDS
jgi:hypothetical protein